MADEAKETKENTVMIKDFGEATIVRTPSPERVEKREDGTDKVIPAKPGKLSSTQKVLDAFMAEATGIPDYTAVRKKITEGEVKLAKVIVENGLAPRMKQDCADWEWQGGIGEGNSYELTGDMVRKVRDISTGKEHNQYGVFTMKKTAPNPFKKDEVFEKISADCKKHWEKKLGL